VLLIFSALVGIHIYFIYAVYGQSPSRKTRSSQFHALRITVKLRMTFLQPELFCVAESVHSIPLTCIIQYCRHAV